MKVERPLLGIYQDRRFYSRTLYLGLLSVYFSMMLIFNYYIIRSLGIIVTLEGTSLFVNLVMIFVEVATGNYFLFLLWIYAKQFDPVIGFKRGYHNRLIVNTTEINEKKEPSITIIIPLYREPFPIVKRTIDATFDVVYPKSKLKVMVIEDSPKDPSIANYCNTQKIEYHKRTERTGFKAGAINVALTKTSDEFVFFLDADHIIEPYALINSLNGLTEKSIAVQLRIDFVNMHTFLTKMGAFLQLQFYSLFQRGRANTGSAIFAGGSCLFDRKKLLKEGGMNPLTIADDTDTSVILIGRGHRIEYIDVIGSWALVPWDPLSLIRQLWRWMTGVTRSARARTFQLIKSNAPFYVKLDLSFALLFPTIGVISWLSSILLGYIVYFHVDLPRYSAVLTIIGFQLPITSLILAALGSIPLVSGLGALLRDDKTIIYVRRGNISKFTNIVVYYMLVAAGQPLLIGAVLKGWFGSKVTFNRTPKSKGSSADHLKYLKNQYLLMSIVIFMIGISLFLVVLHDNFQSPQVIALLFNTYISIIPLTFALLWYGKLEDYLAKTNEISSDMLLKHKEF